MNTKQESLLALSTILITSGVTVINQSLFAGVALSVLGVAIIFARGYFKQK